MLTLASTPGVPVGRLIELLTATGRAGWPAPYVAAGELVHGADAADLPRRTAAGKRKAAMARFKGDAFWELHAFDPPSVYEYLVDVAHRRATSNGVVGVLLYPDHLALLQRFGIDLNMAPAPLRWVRVRCDDRVAQAVALADAERQADAPPDAHTPVDVDAVVRALDQIDEWERTWDLELRGRAEPCLDLWTEDLVYGLMDAVADTLEQLGEDRIEARTLAADAVAQLGQGPVIVEPLTPPERVDAVLATRPELADRRRAR